MQMARKLTAAATVVGALALILAATSASSASAVGNQCVGSMNFSASPAAIRRATTSTDVGCEAAGAARFAATAAGLCDTGGVVAQSYRVGVHRTFDRVVFSFTGGTRAGRIPQATSRRSMRMAPGCQSRSRAALSCRSCFFRLVPMGPTATQPPPSERRPHTCRCFSRSSPRATSRGMCPTGSASRARRDITCLP